jgi:hypothetical protein
MTQLILDKIKGCNLCEREVPLVNGHIIPRFISKHSKLNVNSKRFRNVTCDVNKSFQDIDKIKLFCANCDNKYSTYESYFSKVFFNKTGCINFNSDNLNKFITFTNYKILLSIIDNYKKTDYFEDLEHLKTYLKEILKNEKPDNKLYHYLIFLDNYEKLKLELINSDFSSNIILADDTTLNYLLVFSELFDRQYKVCFGNLGAI